MINDTTREPPSSPSPPNENNEDQQHLSSKITSTSSTSTATDGAASVNSHGQGAAAWPATVGLTRKNEEKRGTRLGMLMEEHSVLSNSLSPFPVPILNTPAACSTVTPPSSTRWRSSGAEDRTLSGGDAPSYGVPYCGDVDVNHGMVPSDHRLLPTSYSTQRNPAKQPYQAVLRRRRLIPDPLLQSDPL